MTTKINTPVGVDVDSVSTTQLWDLGENAYGDDGSTWVYVQANGAITQYNAVAMTQAWQCAKLTKTLADGGQKIGFAQVAFADNEYGWILVKGAGSSFKVTAKNSCLPAVALYTSGTAGYLDDTSGSQTQVYGVVLTDTATSSGAAEEIHITVEPFSSAA